MPPKRMEWVQGFLVLMLGTIIVLLTDLVLTMDAEISPNYPLTVERISPEIGELLVEAMSEPWKGNFTPLGRAQNLFGTHFFFKALLN